MLILDEKIFIIEVKSGLSEPRNATDQGRLITLTKAANAKNWRIRTAGRIHD